MGELTSGEKREMRQRNVSIISGFIGAITSAAGLLIAYSFYKNYNIVANLNDEAKGLIIKGIAIVGVILIVVYSIISTLSTLLFPSLISSKYIDSIIKDEEKRKKK